MILLTVVLLCRNRPQWAVEAIKSILNQTDDSFRFVISDNSSTKELQAILKADFPFIEYVSWFPGLPLCKHLKEVISLVDTPYFVMFHDDDLMEPNYVRRILEQFRNTSSAAAAIGTNAYLIDRTGKHIDNSTMFVSRHRLEFFSDKRTFILQYLTGTRSLSGISPFSSYAYNSALINGVFPDDSIAGKYFDTLFIAEIINRGQVIWINEPLIKTRVHDDSLSYSSGVSDYKPFISLIRHDFGQAIDQRYIDEYRFLRLYFALKKRRRLPPPALKFFVRVFPKLMICSYSFRKLVLNKLIRIISK